MDNPTALITGGSRGIGLEIARRLAGMNYNLILVSRTEPTLVTAAAALREDFGIAIEFVATDIADFDDTATKLHNVLAKYQHLNILINAAGVAPKGTIELSAEAFSRAFDVNVTGAHNVCFVCREALARANGAEIINISSISGIESTAALGAYSASKFAVLGYSGSLAKELIGQDIRVTAICPDLVETEMGQSLSDRTEGMLHVSDIAKTVEFILNMSRRVMIDPIVLRRREVVEFAGAMEMTTIRT